MPNWMRPLPLSVARPGTSPPAASAFSDGRSENDPLAFRGTPVWLGTGIESGETLFGLPFLRETGARTRFRFLEPLPLPGRDLAGVDRVIAGEESGPGARPVAPDRVRRVRDECRWSRTPFLFEP